MNEMKEIREMFIAGYIGQKKESATLKIGHLINVFEEQKEKK